MQTIGDRIKEIRKTKGLTQEGLGDKCEPKMKDSAIRRYENNKGNPTHKTLLKIAKALDVSVSELYGDSEDVLQDFKMKVIEKHPILRVAHENNQTDSFLYEPTLNRAILEELNITEDKQELLVLYNQLNKTGQAEAKKRVKELTFIPEYTDENKNSQPQND